MNVHRVVFVAVVIIVGGASTWLATRRSMPCYQGKDVYDWMFLQTSSALESSLGFMAIGSNAVPYLARALALEQTPFDRYQWVRSRAFQTIAQQWNLGFQWRKPAREVRHRAAFSLLAFGFEARPALPQLHAELLRAREFDRQTIVHCLSALGPLPESIPWLVKAFPLTTNETWVVRHDLLHALGSAGTNAATLAMPIVIASLADPEWSVRTMAAQTLARCGQHSPQAIPLLLSLLRSTNQTAATSAAMALGRITNRCDEAISGLRALLESTNDYTRAVTSVTLWRLGGDAEESRRALENLLASPTARGVAARSLGEMGSSARASVPALLKASRENIGAWVDMYDRAQCAKAVLRIEGESPEACAVLEEAITHEQNRWVRETMVGEIGQLGSLARPLLPALRKALHDSNRDVRHEAGLTLERFGKVQ